MVAVSILSSALLVLLSAALTARGVIDKSQFVGAASSSAASRAATSLGNAGSLAAGTTNSAVSGIPQGQVSTVVSTYGGSPYLKRADVSVTWGAASGKTAFSAGSMSFSTLVSQPNEIVGLYNTGVDNAGAMLAQGATDSHYTIISGPQTGAVYIAPADPGWIARTSNSQWISPSAAQSASLPSGTYQVRTTFTVVGSPSGIAIALSCAADDTISDIQLNGVSVAANIGGRSAWANLTLSSGFIRGANVLDFYVSNAAPGPCGLQVQMTGTP